MDPQASVGGVPVPSGRARDGPSHAKPEKKRWRQQLDKWTRWLIDGHSQMPSRPSVPRRPAYLRTRRAAPPSTLAANPQPCLAYIRCTYKFKVYLAVAIILPFLLLDDSSLFSNFFPPMDPFGCCCPLCVATRFNSLSADMRYRNAIVWGFVIWILLVLREIWDRSERLIRAFYTPDQSWSFSFHHFIYSGPDLCRMHSLWRFSEKLKRMCLVDIMFGSTTLLLSFYSVPMMILFSRWILWVICDVLEAFNWGTAELELEFNYCFAVHQNLGFNSVPEN